MQVAAVLIFSLIYLVNSEIEITSFDHIELTELKKTITPLGAVRYTFGNRQNDDVLVFSKSESKSFSYPTRLQSVFKYPPIGALGAAVTFIEIDVQQGSKAGRAFLSSGGIGQSNVQVVIEAEDTTYLSYDGKVYGIW